MAVIADPMGCSEQDSRDAATANTSFSLTAWIGIISTTCNLPRVRVPVLSKAIARMRPIISNLAPFLNKIPCFAPLAIPDNKAGIIEAIKAQGEATTRKIKAR